MQRLTPPGGARELLPAEYAYTLPARRAAGARPRPLPFRAAARSPRGGEPAVAPLGALHAMRTVTLYSRAGCHLCDDARAGSSAIRRTHAVRAREIDIESDDALHKRYLERIPVVALDGEELFELLRRRGDAAAERSRVNRA